MGNNTSIQPHINWLDYLERQKDTYKHKSDYQEKEFIDAKGRWEENKLMYDIINQKIEEEKDANKLKSDENKDSIKTQYNDIFQKFKEFKINQLNIVKEEIDIDLENYISNKLAEKGTEELYNDSIKKDSALTVDIDNYYKKISTNERKVYYQDEQIENAEWYQKLILIMYYALIVIYILFGPFIWKQGYKRISIWILMILYIILPFVLNYLIRFIFVNFSVDIKSNLDFNFFKKIF
jgi:hypothetical protein